MIARDLAAYSPPRTIMCPVEMKLACDTSRASPRQHARNLRATVGFHTPPRSRWAGKSSFAGENMSQFGTGSKARRCTDFHFCGSDRECSFGTPRRCIPGRLFAHFSTGSCPLSTRVPLTPSHFMLVPISYRMGGRVSPASRCPEDATSRESDAASAHQTDTLESTSGHEGGRDEAVGGGTSLRYSLVASE